MADQEVKSLVDLGSLTGDAPEAPAAPVYEQKLDAQGRAYATGKRKDAVARVWIKPGPGKITVNDKDYVDYFARPVLQMIQVHLAFHRLLQVAAHSPRQMQSPYPIRPRKAVHHHPLTCRCPYQAKSQVNLPKHPKPPH